MGDWDLRWRQAALWFAGAVLAVPLAVAWAFILVSRVIQRCLRSGRDADVGGLDDGHRGSVRYG